MRYTIKPLAAFQIISDESESPKPKACKPRILKLEVPGFSGLRLSFFRVSF
jgi:hypothetical protein